MVKFKIIFLSILIIICNSCSKDNLKKSVINEKSLELQVLEAYEEGVEALEGGDVLFAAKKFNEAEILFPQSKWAPNSALMAAYSYYTQDYYGDAIAELERFIRVYPSHKNLSYAHYLLGICYYEQIVDEKKDLQSIKNAKKKFEFILENYPNTEYSIDADFKIDLINDILASKEMYIGRFYFDKKKWIPAIRRFRTVIDDYDTTIYTEEALHRLVEVHYTIGLIDEAEKYAQLLGYNYKSSEWYENSYSLFNKNYEIKKRNRLETKKKIQNIFTKVLKGHIAVASTNLNKDFTGRKIDIKARKFLKKDGLDYEHGTGHGVGYFLNVHEGPQSISKLNNIKIQPGMILSNEPGYYKKNDFGIRIENLIYAKKVKNKILFKNLTLAPIEKDLINFDLLNNKEKNYLFKYHLDIYSKLFEYLNKTERKWLASLLKHF